MWQNPNEKFTALKYSRLHSVGNLSQRQGVSGSWHYHNFRAFGPKSSKSHKKFSPKIARHELMSIQIIEHV